MFQGIAYPLPFFKRKRKSSPYNPIQVHHEDPFSLFTINLGREEGLGDFLRLDERPSVQATQNKQKWKLFLSQIVWFFYEKFKGKKTRGGHLIFEEI